MSATTPMVDLGPLVAAADVDDAVVEVLRERMPAHVAVFNAERGIALEDPREYAVALSNLELIDHMLPCVVSQTARMQSASGGMSKVYEGDWRTEVSVVVRGRDPQETRRTASYYEAIVRRLMVQHPRRSPLDWIHFTGMVLNEAPGDQRAGRYLLEAVSIFQVRSERIVDPNGGSLGEVDTLDIDLIKEPL